ncbi:MAG: hypothetical protein VSS75_009790 [Candidatus Parabeggiatoa sp.]|nr:hypothetical protein [Candidatus Parabeggiatoa sp.]
MNTELKKLQFQFIAFIFICLILSLLSIFSTLGTFAMFIEKSTNSGEVYQALMNQKMKILDSMDCVSLTESQIQSKREALGAILAKPTTNSRGTRAGSLGAMSGNCLSNNWYAKNRCSSYLSQKSQVEFEIEKSRKCSGLSSKLQTIESQLEQLPPSDNLALFTLISSVSTYTVDDMVFLVFACLAVLIEIAIIFQTFSFNRKKTLTSLMLLIVLASISIGLNAIFWASLGNFSTFFQIFSAIVGIVLDVLKINFMLDISEIYSIISSTHFDENGFRVFEGQYKNLNTEQKLKTKAVNFEIQVVKNLTQEALENGEITCNKDEIFSYLRKRGITIDLEVIDDWMKEWFSNHPPT